MTAVQYQLITTKILQCNMAHIGDHIHTVGKDYYKSYSVHLA